MRCDKTAETEQPSMDYSIRPSPSHAEMTGNGCGVCLDSPFGIPLQALVCRAAEVLIPDLDSIPRLRHLPFHTTDLFPSDSCKIFFLDLHEQSGLGTVPALAR